MRQTMMLIALAVASAIPFASAATAQSAQRRPGLTDMMQIPHDAVIRSENVDPIPRSKDLVTDTDYPPSALREGRSGRTFFKVQVSTGGMVTKCIVTGTSGSADLDEATCSIVQRRARFSLALDKDGKATDGEYSNSIRWQIPGAPFQIQPYPPGYTLTH